MESILRLLALIPRSSKGPLLGLSPASLPHPAISCIVCETEYCFCASLCRRYGARPVTEKITERKPHDAYQPHHRSGSFGSHLVSRNDLHPDAGSDQNRH